MPCIRLPSRAMCWSMAGGGLIGNLSGHCPTSALSPGKTVVRRTVAATFRFAPHSSSACWAQLTLVGQPQRVRLPALKAPPVRHRWYTVVRNKH